MVATIGITVYRYYAIKTQKNVTAEAVNRLNEVVAASPSITGEKFMSTRTLTNKVNAMVNEQLVATGHGNPEDRSQMARELAAAAAAADERDLGRGGQGSAHMQLGREGRESIGKGEREGS